MRREGSPTSPIPMNNNDVDSSDSSTTDIFINPQDGLRFQDMDDVNYRTRQRLLEIGVDVNLLGSQLNSLSLEDFISSGPNGPADEDVTFPTSLIVTGLDESFFESSNHKEEFERIFRSYTNRGSNGTIAEAPPAFYYFKSFKRVRVDYESAASCITARIKVHMSRFGSSSVLKCYFGQPMKSKSKDDFLHPPTPDKQFLISPPASPPVDWEPHPEGHPVLLDYDLISALAKLGPGESHELHKPEADNHPSIVVHIAEEDSEEVKQYKAGLRLIKGGISGSGGNGDQDGIDYDMDTSTSGGVVGVGKIVQTRRPDF